MPIPNDDQADKDKAAVLALLNDIAESEHAIRHRAGFAALLGMLALEMARGRVIDPVEEAEREKREAEDTDKRKAEENAERERMAQEAAAQAREDEAFRDRARAIKKEADDKAAAEKEANKES